MLLSTMNKRKKDKKIKKVSSLPRAIIGVLNGNFLARENVIRNMPFMFYVVLLMVLYIAYGYYAERTVRELHNVDVELKDMRSDYISKRAELEKTEKQSQVAEDIERLGLKESRVPPIKIEVDPEEMTAPIK